MFLDLVDSLLDFSLVFEQNKKIFLKGWLQIDASFRILPLLEFSDSLDLTLIPHTVQ